MTKQGQLTQKGINAQNWAAMSLFLQHVTRSNFSYIGFEGEKLEDFHLVFADGRKVICESKAGVINLSDIRGILDKIIKHAQVTDQDEILIVCKSVNKRAKNLVENFKYFTDRIKRELKSKKHKYEDRHLKLLPQLRFWEVSQDINRQAVEKLMARVLSYPEPFWIPIHKLRRLTKSLVEDTVYKGSQEGETLTRDDFLSLLKNEKIRILEDDGYNYEDVKQTNEKDVKDIIKSIKSRSKKLNVNNELTMLYANPSIHHFTLLKLENEKKLNLSDWGNLWEATYQSAFSIELFKIFTNNIKTKDNQQFALDFVLEKLGGPTNYFREEFIKYDIVKLCNEILKISPSLEVKVFEVIKKVYEHSIDRFLYVKRRSDDSWERERVAELLEELYKKSKNKDLKQEIINYIVSNFNLVEDDGQFWHYTPPSVFRILRKFVSHDPENIVPWFTKKCIEQYGKFYKTFSKKLAFSGWEYSGSSISQTGNSFSIADRHFVTQVLTPALRKLYNSNNEEGLNFIQEYCLSKVNKDKPDFLNRAALPILLDEYRDGVYSKEIFEILKAFVEMRKGIPWKNDLVFQALNTDDFTDEQKWRLIEISLDEFDSLPTNVFVEKIVFNIASKPSSKLVERAGDVITSWIQNPKYNAMHTIGSYEPMDGLGQLLENNFDKAVNLLKSYLSSDHFINKLVDFDAYDAAKTVATVIDKNLDKGLNLLESIYSYGNLSKNQQIALCSGISDISDDKSERLLQVFNKFLKPKLIELLGDRVDVEKLKDIDPIERKISYRHARESLVQFAEKLAKVAKKEYLDAALWLVKVFVHDSDPPKDGSNYPDDPKGEFNKHQNIIGGEDDHSIQTIRGYCCWVIQKLVIPRNPQTTEQTRAIIKELLPTLRDLAFDGNYYVRVESCIPLIELVKNRHTHLPDKPKERFVSEAIAENIEKIPFDMLYNPKNLKLKAVMKNLAMVFSYIRTLGTKDAKKVLETFLNSEYDEVTTEITPLLIFYALFRKDAYKDWQWEKLDKFEHTKLEKLFEEQLSKGSPVLKAKLAWQLERLPDEIKNIPEDKRTLGVTDTVKLSAKYLLKLTKKYDHDVFNHIYRFIEENIGDYFDICLELWTKCIEIESKYFKENWAEEKLHEMYWWPFFYNGKILANILENKDTNEYLKWFKILAQYPVNVLIANDLDVAVKKLVDIKDKRYKKEVEYLFDLLIKRNPEYYEFKQRWLKKDI